MPALIFLFVLSLSAFAKQNWCEFDTTFSEKFMEARSNYARHLSQGRGEKDPSDYNFGKKRALQHGKKWTALSLRQTIQSMFGDVELDYRLKPNGKMLVFPKGAKTGDKVIFMDPSGEYFRITQAKVSTNGTVRETQIFYDHQGKELPLNGELTEAQRDLHAEKTHFRALP